MFINSLTHSFIHSFIYLLACLLACLVGWLVPSFNALSHIKCKNQLQLNIFDVVSFAMNYAVIGLEREERIFKSNAYPFLLHHSYSPNPGMIHLINLLSFTSNSYPHREKHLMQHQELRLKIRAIQQQIPTTDPVIVATRVRV